MIAVSTPTCADPEKYPLFEKYISDRVANNKQPLFTTDANSDLLWLTYLSQLPFNRQHYNCNCCRRFIQQYGGLVTIEKGVVTVPLLWEKNSAAVPAFFRDAVTQLWAIVKTAKVTGLFLTKEEVWGNPISASKPGVTIWTHIHGLTKEVVKHPLKTAYQMMAEKAEDFKLLKSTVLQPKLKQAVTVAQQILNQGSLYRSEKAEGICNWLSELLTEIQYLTGEERDRRLWLAVATAPVGFCHVKNTVLGTLLEDIESGYSFDVISSRWQKKLHPLQYQRPTAAPTAGNIAAAERIFKEMNLEASLQRRYALLSELPQSQMLWTPKAAETPAFAGIFAGLKATKDHPKLQLKSATMTWAVFSRDLLPSVTKMVAGVPTIGSFYGLVTATDPDSKPLLQWDRQEQRNPVSWYFYDNGSHCSRWQLYQKAEVTAIFNCPANWYGNSYSTQRSIFFALKGAKDKESNSLYLFPETLRSELREVRATIEAYSKTKKATTVDGEQANGLSGFPITVEVTTAAGTQTVTIDRLE